MGHDLSIRVVGALHGFLGQGADWNPVKENSKIEQWLTPSLFQPDSDSDLFSEIQNSRAKKIFVGYSLGGRIGLSLLEKSPQLFDHYIFVSVNPGFSSGDQTARQQRWQSDLAWADKLTPENWDRFLRDWNSQAVFAGATGEPERKLQDFDLVKLKTYLLEYSLAKQPDYSELIRENRNRISWVAGSRDKKFLEIAKTLKAGNIINGYSEIESGHRIPFDSPKKLQQIIENVTV